MSELVIERVWSGPLKDVSLLRERGLTLIVGAESDGTAELIALCAGVASPRRGRVSVGGARPSASPVCRRGVASLLAEEPQLGPGDVGHWLAALATLNGIDPSAALEHGGIGPERKLESLSAAERRELALAIALAHPQPTLLALHEPLAACAASRREPLLSRLAQLAEEVPVLIVTASIASARRFGGKTLLLDRGIATEKPAGAWPGSLTAGLDAWLWVEADAPRGLVAALAQHPDVQEIAYDEGLGRVILRGPDLERLALAVGNAAVNAGVNVRVLRSPPEDLAAARGAQSGAIDAIQAYRAAHARERAGPSGGGTGSGDAGGSGSATAPVAAPPAADAALNTREPTP